MIYGSIMDIKALAGLSDADITDEELSVILELARRIVFDRVGSKVFRELPSRIGDSYTVYQVKNYPILDANGDGVVDGKDIKVEAKANTESFDMWEILTVSNVKADYGLIQLAQAVDPTKTVYVTYTYIPPQVNATDLDDAVNLMACHLISVRLQNPDTVAISDLNKNELIVKEDEDKFLKLYKLKEQVILAKKSFRWSL